MAGSNGRVVGFATVAPPLSEGERLRELAKQIRTRAQLEEILADVVPALRDDVRALLETLVVLDDDDALPE